MINYTKTPEGIYVLKFTKTLYLSELESFLKKFIQLPDLPQNIRILYDLLDAQIGFTINELDQLLALANKAIEHFHTVRTAILVKGKLETAYSFILKKHSAGKYRQREVFNTYKAAITWLESE